MINQLINLYENILLTKCIFDIIDPLCLKKDMKFKVAKITYNILCNIPVCFCLCLTSSIIGVSIYEDAILTINFNNISLVNLFINFGVSFVIAMLIGMFIPLTKIGKWFTSLFKIKNETYTNNVPYRLLATLISSIIFYIIITPSLTLLNCFLNPGQNIYQILINMAFAFPWMTLVGFTSSLKILFVASFILEAFI